MLHACYQAPLVVQMVENPPVTQEAWVRYLGWEDPLEEGMATHSSFLAWRIPMDRESPWTEESVSTELDTTKHMNLKRVNFSKGNEEW